MKNCILLNVLILVFGTTGLLEAPRSATLRTERSNDFRYGTPISQDQLDANGTYIINLPGRYFLPGPLIFPQGQPGPVIRVSTGDVQIDLNGKSISGFLPNNQVIPGLVGIAIDGGVGNVEIKNGSILGMDGGAIVAGYSGDNVQIDRVRIFDFFIDLCPGGGILFNAVNQAQIFQVTVNGCSGPALVPGLPFGPNGIGGMSLVNCVKVTMSECDFHGNGSPARVSHGVYASNCSDCNFTNSEADSNNGLVSYGFRFVNGSTGNVLQHCVAPRNIAIGGNAYGFAVEKGVIDIFGTPGAASSNTHMIHCDAYGNKSDETVYGFYFADAQRNIIEHCVSHCQDAQAGTGNAYGFYSSNGFGNRFEQCLAEGNMSGSADTCVAAGFAFENHEQNSIITCSKSYANTGGVDGTVGQAYGIKLGQDDNDTLNTDLTKQVDRCVVTNNEISLNKGKQQYGYKDFRGTGTAAPKNGKIGSTTFLAKNVAFGQGYIFTGSDYTVTDDMNYCFQFNDADKRNDELIIETTIANMQPISTATGFTNFSVVQQSL